MNKATIIAAIGSLIGLGTALAPQIHADVWNELTKVTFSQPVEIPGQVLLPGTYTFKLMDSLQDRHIVQIYNASDTKQIAMLLTIPDFRETPADKTVITFEERAAGAPHAINSWFYPGDQIGQQFVYGKTSAAKSAK